MLRKCTVLTIITFLVMICLKANATDLNGDPFYDSQPGNSISENQVYLKTNSQENINPATGGLTIVATDISLPGRNGLDLNINRVYRSRHLVAKASNTYSSNYEFIPQWSNLGIGWKCFLAVFDRHTYGDPLIPALALQATLHLGDGRLIKFYRETTSATVYYAVSSEKWKVVITAAGPVLYMDNGVKYYFGCKLDEKTWGFYGDRDCVTKIEDNNGNYISINYRFQSAGHAPESEIDYIIDTWKRRINYYWSDDRSYTYIGNNPKHKLDSIKVIPLDNDEIKTYKYIYTTIDVGYAKWIYTSDGYYTDTDPTWVSSLTEIKCNDQTVVNYSYGGDNGVQDYYEWNNLPNANRGQLIEVSYPWGGKDKYQYRIYCDQAWWSSPYSKYYSMIVGKGNATHDSLISFTYYSNTYDTMRLLPWRSYWDHTVVKNNYDSLKSIYYYKSQKASITYGDSIPLINNVVEYDLSTGGILRTTTSNWLCKTFSFGAIIWKYAYLPSSTVVTGTDINKTTSYEYPASYNYTNYNNIIKMIDGNREVRYDYLHFSDTKYCCDTTWICDRTTSKAVYSNLALNSLTRYKYDALTSYVYSLTPLCHSSKYNNSSATLARGNLNYIIDSLGNAPRDSIRQTIYYDECGNIIQKTDGNGNNTFYYYNLSSPGTVGQDKTTDPDYLRRIINSGYGLSAVYSNYCLGQKMYEWTPQNDTTFYSYEPIFNRPYKVMKMGDTESNPSVLYQYHDIYPAYTEITKKQNEFSNIYKEVYNYDINGNLAKKAQGNIEVDYAYNNSGMLLTETVPHYSTESAPLKYKYYYDGLKRKKLVIAPDNTATNFYYGANWRKVLDAEGDSTIYRYDNFGRLVSVTDALGDTTTYVYNILNNLTSITTPDDKELRYHYDALGRLTGKHDSDMDSTYFHYDKNGNVDSLQDANLMAAGKYMVNRYDGIDRLNKTLVKSATDSTVLVQNIYDRYDFATLSEYGYEVPGESLFVNIPDNNTIHYTNLTPAYSAQSANDSIYFLYKPSFTVAEGYPHYEDTLSWKIPRDAFIDMNGTVYDNDSLLVSTTPQTCNILYSFPIFQQRNRTATAPLSSPFETALKPGAVVDSAVFSLYVFYYETGGKDYTPLQVDVCNPLPLLSGGEYADWDYVTQPILNTPVLQTIFNYYGYRPFKIKDFCQYFCDVSLDDYNNDNAENPFPTIRFSIYDPYASDQHTAYFSGNYSDTSKHPKLAMYMHSADHDIRSWPG